MRKVREPKDWEQEIDCSFCGGRYVVVETDLTRQKVSGVELRKQIVSTCPYCEHECVHDNETVPYLIKDRIGMFKITENVSP